MSSITCARTSHVDVRASRIDRNALLIPVAGVRNVVHQLAVAAGAVSLAACAQSSAVTTMTEMPAASRQASLEQKRPTSFGTNRSPGGEERHTPSASNKNAVDRRFASHGVASFYTEGALTASGEKFDTRALTAAHRTLPFGTRLRVTNVATGRSVVVRINDRGPFIAGRVVDVSYSAAEALGMIGGGIAKVKLSVVR